ncbi:MAG: tRNA 4-thiouridine(8) synthase ThiI [Halobacteriovoraceae bacterium]|nr:tRNA 4-thiouridine(8) synthase ThiI [Halobacteriovoraceae bacterium]
MNTLLISIDELWLKKGNRPIYFQAVISHIKKTLSKYLTEDVFCKIDNLRILLKTKEKLNSQCMESLTKIPGIHSIMPVKRIDPVYRDLFPLIEQETEQLAGAGYTFKVITKRLDKKFPKTSMEVCSEAGAFILKKFPSMRVDLSDPKIKIHIVINSNAIYLSTRKIPGTGGLPWGTGGHVITLLSGGFDSPVASYLMSKRGCKQTFIFFYSYPFVGEEVKEKILDLFSILGAYQKDTRLYVIPFGELQKFIAEKYNPDYRTMLFRRSMIECANQLAGELAADALLTGDSLGQVSSQTIHNLSLLDQFSARPILRPLIGFNKKEIIKLAKKIDTHSVSVRPHDDACSLFSVKHPILRPDIKYWNFLEKDLHLKKRSKQYLKNAEVYDISKKGETYESALSFD